MKNFIKIIKYLISILFVIIFFSPLYVPLIYESYRENYYWYEIVLYVGVLLSLVLIFNKLDKTNK